jgi:hypothetical protein
VTMIAWSVSGCAALAEPGVGSVAVAEASAPPEAAASLVPAVLVLCAAAGIAGMNAAAATEAKRIVRFTGAPVFGRFEGAVERMIYYRKMGIG